MCVVPALPALTAAFSSVGTALSGALGLGGAAAGTAAAGAGSIWGTLGTVATVGSGVLSAYSAVQNANAASAAASATAKQQDQAAQQALEQGDRESELQRRRTAGLIGENKAALAANGIDVNSTSALELLSDIRMQADEDAFSIREDAVRSANSFGQQAANSRADAKSAKSSARWGAINTLAGTVATVGERYRPYVNQNRVKAQGGY